jgi:hypothetical protein
MQSRARQQAIFGCVSAALGAAVKLLRLAIGLWTPRKIVAPREETDE